MASTSTSPAPYQPPPLAARSTPMRDIRAASPSTPRHTAKLWDEYERWAIENARRRETTCGNSSVYTRSQRLSNGTVLDIIKSYDSTTSALSTPQFDFNFPTAPHRNSISPPCSTTLAICKSCTQSINATSGVCEQCMKTILLPASNSTGESTPLLSHSARNFASTDLPKLRNNKSTSGASTPRPSSSPKRNSHSPPPPSTVSGRMSDPPIRLSSLRPPPDVSESPSATLSADPARTAADTYPSHPQPSPRKTSLTDPNEPFLRLQISRKPVQCKPHASPHRAHPSLSAPSSRTHTRPCSLASVQEGSHYHYPSPIYPPTGSSCHPEAGTRTAANYSRHISATPSELSTLYPYLSSASPPNAATRPPLTASCASAHHSLHRASFSLQNTTSAWDDWDSDEEGGSDRAGLVGYWRGKKWRGSRGSFVVGDEGSTRRGSEIEGGKEDGSTRARGKEEKGKARRKRRGFASVFSCGGCSGKD